MHRLRIGSFLSLPMGILLLVLFFFPWVRVSCGVPDANATVATASGWQLTLGRYSEPDYEQEGGAKLANELRVPAGTSVDSRPKFILGLVAALGTLAVAGLGLWGKLPADGAGHLLTLLGVLGVITMILAVFVDFEQEINRGLEQRPGVEASVAAATTRPAGGEAISDDRTRVARAVAELWANKGRKSLVRKETTPYLWLSLVVYMLVGGTGAGMVLLGRIGAAEERTRQALITPAPKKPRELPRVRRREPEAPERAPAEAPDARGEATEDDTDESDEAPTDEDEVVPGG